MCSSFAEIVLLVFYVVPIYGNPAELILIKHDGTVLNLKTRHCKAGVYFIEPQTFRCACINGVWGIYGKYCEEPLAVVAAEYGCFKLPLNFTFQQFIVFGDSRNPFEPAIAFFRHYYKLYVSYYATEERNLDVDASTSFITITNHSWQIESGSRKVVCLQGKPPTNNGRKNFCYFYEDDWTKGQKVIWNNIARIKPGCDNTTSDIQVASLCIDIGWNSGFPKKNGQYVCEKELTIVSNGAKLISREITKPEPILDFPTTPSSIKTTSPADAFIDFPSANKPVPDPFETTTTPIGLDFPDPIVTTGHALELDFPDPIVTTGRALKLDFPDPIVTTGDALELDFPDPVTPENEISELDFSQPMLNNAFPLELDFPDRPETQLPLKMTMDKTIYPNTCVDGVSRADVQTYWKTTQAEAQCPKSLSQGVFKFQLERLASKKLSQLFESRVRSLDQIKIMLKYILQLMLKTCPSKAVPHEFLIEATDAFTMFVFDDFFYGVEEIESDTFERFRIALRKCIDRAKTFNISMEERECSNIEVTGKLTVGHSRQFNIDIPPEASYRNHEPLIESIWKMFLNAHAYCYTDFQIGNDHHHFSVVFLKLFSKSIYEKWTSPLENDEIYRFIVPSAINLGLTMKNLDYCVGAASIVSICPTWLPRGSTPEISRKKRSVWELHLQVSRTETSIWGGTAHCIQNPEDPAFNLGYARCAHPP